MLTYDLQKTPKTPLYMALYQAIKSDITAGILKPGDKLPSKRTLAKHLRLGVTTVENAYAQLLVEGYISSTEKRGYFVAHSAAFPAPLMPAPPLKPPRTQKAAVFDLASNAIPESRFPFSVWAKLARSVLSEGRNLMSAIPYNGVPELRTAIARHLYSYRGLSVSPEQIVIGAGTETLYQYLVQFLGRDRIYGVENPGYHQIVDMYKKAGAECRFADIDQNGVTAEQLIKKQISVIHISPAHHFPTGIVMPVSRRSQLLEWAEKGNYIIEDEYDSEFRFTGKPIPPLMRMDQRQRVIYVNTFSKTISPAIRISYMVLPPALAEKYKQEMGFYSCTVSAFEQHTLAEFIRQGYFEKHINRMKTYYKNQRNALISAITNSRFRNFVHIEEANAGLHFLIRLNTQKSDQEIGEILEAAGIRVSFLSAYTMPPADTHSLVINYTGTNMEQLPNALRALEEQALL